MRILLSRLKERKGDSAMMLAAILTLIASCVTVSSKKFFWNDELYSWYFLADPSFTHMWAAFGDKINNTPALYFVLGWLWVQVAGASELSLRLFSSLGLCTAMVIVWATLRKVYGFWPTCVGTLVVFLTSDLVLTQNAEARMYGLYLALAAAAVYQFVSIAVRGSYTRGNLISIALVHAAIVNTHLFGPFYSGVVLVAFAVTDWQHRRFSRGIYGAIVAGWVTFLLYVPAFLVQSDAGNPRSWIPEPTVSELLDVLGLVTPSFVAVGFVSALILCLLLSYALRQGIARRTAPDATAVPSSGAAARGVADVTAAPRGEQALLLVAFLLVAVPVATWLISRIWRPIFLDRYVMPSIITYCIVLAHFTSRYLAGPREQMDVPASRMNQYSRATGRISQAMLATLVLASLINPLSVGSGPSPARPDSGDAAMGHAELPIVVQSSQAFLQRWHYAEQRARYYFILDRESAMDEASGRFGSQEYKHLDAFQRNYPGGVGTHILQSEEFLRRFDRFLVLDAAEYDRSCPTAVRGFGTVGHCPQWVERRLLRNPAYRVTNLGPIGGTDAMLLVERTDASLN